MPPESTVQTFIDALRTGRTRTTRAFDELFASPSTLAASLTPDQRAAFQASGGLRPLAGWMKERLKGVSEPLSDAELQHIDEWPPLQTDQVRLAMAQGFDDDVAVQFSWEIHSGAGPATVVVNRGNAGIFVTFRSPRHRVRLEGDSAVFVGS